MVSKHEADATAAKAAAVVGTLQTEPLDDESRAIAERRLAQIVEVLGLDPASFKTAREAAMAASDGSAERILSAQCREVTDALSSIDDPALRLRLVQLFAALTDDNSD